MGQRRPAALVALVALTLFAARAMAKDRATGTIAGRVSAERYLDEVVVYVVQAPGPFPSTTQKLDQKKMTFIPHVLAVTRGDVVVFQNHDIFDHNVFSPDREGYNIGIFAHGQTRSYVFNEVGVYTQLCNIHPSMLAYIFVSQNPYLAVADRSGRYRIPNVPPGTYRLAVWNSHGVAPEQTVTVMAGGTVEANFTVKKKPAED